MGAVLSIDEASQCARVQAGAYGPALEEGLRHAGLTLRHYPQSFEFSTLGGWIATRGGGHFATGPTHVDELVQSLRVVCPAGATETRRVPASGAGPCEHRLYVGSEGALGLITEAWVKLRPRPRARASATLLFAADDADAAFARGAAAVREMAQTGLQPANLRLVYGPEVSTIAGIGGARRAQLASAAVLLVGLEAPADGPAALRLLDAQLSLLVDVAESAPHGGTVLVRRAARGLGGGKGGGERDGIAGAWGSAFMRGGYHFSASCLFALPAPRLS
ncbi:unnamed protein product [Prorocentrum cordatum]|uniref:Alkylglycerone-phosphate synthase n=1 Tax=Prorocentrum cordatum TaxID=2364126 RepID=A0ABN9T6G8_9DINO|nr:unnamed protein product [Polarella glacialis]